MCQHVLAKRCPDIWQSAVSGYACKALSKDTSIWNQWTEWKLIHTHSCGWALSNPSRVQVEQKGKGWVLPLPPLIYLLIGLSFELKSLCLQSRYSTASATPLIHFALHILEIGGGVSWIICPGWPRTTILSNSAPQVARITDVSHWHPSF
jgi:hypothetical protein